MNDFEDKVNYINSNSSEENISTSNSENSPYSPAPTSPSNYQKVESYNERYPKEQARLRNHIFKEYLKKKSDDGEDIPVKITRRGYGPDRERIFEEIVDFFGEKLGSTYFYQGWFHLTIKDLVAEQIKRDGKSTPSARERKQAHKLDVRKQKQFANKLEKWIKDLDKKGGKLRYNKACRGIDYRWISEQTGVSYFHLTQAKTLCRKIIQKAEWDIGIESFLIFEKNNHREYTYQKLLDYGTECRSAEVKGNKSAQSQVNYTRHTLIKFIKVKGLTLESKIGSEFGILFGESRQEFAVAIPNRETRKKLLSELGKWQNYHSSLIQFDELPPSFSEALTFLVERSGTSYNDLGKLCKPNTKQKSASHVLVYNWARGIQTPSMIYLPLINKIEEFFNLPPDTLTGKIVFNSLSGIQATLRKGKFPRPVGESYAVLAKYLPADFSSLSIDEQQKLVTSANEYISQNKSEYRIWNLQLSQCPFRLKLRNVPDKLIEDIDKLINYKTSKLPPAGYRRSRRGGWKKPSADRSGTIGIFKALAEALFGVLTTPTEKLGAGMQPEQLSLVHLALPVVWRLYFTFIENRNGAIPISMTARNLCMIYSLLDEKWGWIAQSPWLAERLEPIPSIISKEDVFLAKSDWTAFIRKIDLELGDIKLHIKDLEKDMPAVRDSHSPILPILESDSPLDILVDALNEYERNIPDQSTSPVEGATGLRNIILLRILSETALRSHNLLNLTWKADNSGQLYKDPEGNYKIEISYTLFKNSFSSYFGPPRAKHNYKVTLSKKLTPLIDEYLQHTRSFLLNRWAAKNNITGDIHDEEFLFISHPRATQQKLTHFVGSKIMRKFTMAYLVYNPQTGTGIKGVESFAMHGVRHIVATHILKKTGSYEAAADAIQDAPTTVRSHYGRYAPEDRDKKFRHLITDIMEGEHE